MTTHNESMNGSSNIPLQTNRVYSTLKQRGNVRLDVFSAWNTRGVFVEIQFRTFNRQQAFLY